MPRSDAQGDTSPSQLIDARIDELGDWRGQRLGRVRALIHAVDPEVVEEWKWRGVPVWEHDGIICTGETYKAVVKLTFANGAALPDPAGLFNASLEGSTRRAIDLHEGDTLHEEAFRELVHAAVAFNTAKKATKATAKTATAKTATAKTATAKTATAKQPVLLAGGNPQIPKGEGDAPVQAYVEAMPGWKRDVGRHIDELVVRTVPAVRKAVKWNSPFYGAEGQDGWFLSYHCFTRYVKVTFFRGTSLRPVPPGTSKHEDVRYLDIHEDDELDEAQFTDWVRQASELPGERL